MSTRRPDRLVPETEDFDYASPEAQKAFEGLSDLILEIRDEVSKIRYVEDLSLREQNQRIRVLVERFVGPRAAPTAIRLLKPLAWTTRPIRVAVSRRRARRAATEDR